MNDEEAPLIGQEVQTFGAIPIGTVSKVRNKIRAHRVKTLVSATGIVLGLLVLLNCLYLLRITDQLYIQAASFELDHVVVDRNSSESISCTVNGTLAFDYDRINNRYHRKWARILQHVHTVEATFDHDIELSALIQEDKLSISKTRINSALKVDLTAPQILQISIDTIPLAGASELLNRLSVEPQFIRFAAKVPASVKVGRFWSGKHTLQSHFDVELDGNQFIQEFLAGIDFNDFAFTLDGDQVTGNGTITLPDLKWVDYQSDAFSWTILLPACSKAVAVAKLEIDQFTTNSGEVTVHFRIPSIDPDLKEDCGDGSTIENVAKTILSDAPVRLVFRGDELDKQPKWMNDFFKTLEFHASVRLSQFGIPGGGLGTMGVDSLAMDVTDDDSLIIDSSLHIGLDLPNNILIKNINVPLIKGVVELGQSWGSLEMDHWQIADINYDTMQVNVLLDNTAFKIRDPVAMAKIANDFIAGKNISVPINSTIDIEVDSDFLQGTFTGLPANLTYNATGTPVDSLYGNLQIRLDDVQLLKSTSAKCEILVSAGITSDVNFDSDIEGLKFDLLFNGSNVGSIEPGPVHLTPGMFFNTSSKLTLDPVDSLVKLKLEHMLESYLSGYYPEIEVTGNRNSRLGKLLSNVHVPMQLPKVSRQSNTPAILSHDSIFLVDSTMHLMSSEIELTVFNPVSNSDVVVDLIEAQASHEDTTLAYISKEHRIVIPPGLYTTPRIPVTYVTKGIGADILRKALNGKLDIDTIAMLRVHLGEFEVEILYTGSGTSTKIRF